MRRRVVLATVVMAALLVGVMGISGLMGTMSPSAEAGDDLEFEWHVGFGTPIAATASTSPNGIPSFQKIAIEGSGTLEIDAEDRDPKDVDGGGTFVHTTDTDSGASVSGTWEAKQLLMFESYGPPSDGFIAGNPAVFATWRGGRAFILVHLEYDGDGLEADAILEIGCRLPGADGISGTIEGIRLVIDGGLNFNVAEDPKDTLFVDLSEPDDD